MSYVYRRLAGADTSSLKQLLAVFGQAFADVPTYQGAVPSDEYVLNLLNKPDMIFLVALSGTEVIGGIAAYVLQKFEQERKEIYLYDLAVAPDHRRRGVARQLIAELQNIAHNIGAYVIFVQADRGDKPAIKLYESFGEKAEVYHFDITPQ